MPTLNRAIISTTMDLPEPDGPVWYGMPLLEAIAAQLRAQGHRVDSVEQYEDADGGMFCYIGEAAFNVNLMFVDEVHWLVCVRHMRGCLYIGKGDPKKLRPMLLVVHDALSQMPDVRMLGWIEDRLNDDPAEQERFPRPY